MPDESTADGLRWMDSYIRDAAAHFAKQIDDKILIDLSYYLYNKQMKEYEEKLKETLKEPLQEKPILLPYPKEDEGIYF
jgi:hypothetical protein